MDGSETGTYLCLNLSVIILEIPDIIIQVGILECPGWFTRTFGNHSRLLILVDRNPNWIKLKTPFIEVSFSHHNSLDQVIEVWRKSLISHDLIVLDPVFLPGAMDPLRGKLPLGSAFFRVTLDGLGSWEMQWCNEPRSIPLQRDLSRYEWNNHNHYEIQPGTDTWMQLLNHYAVIGPFTWIFWGGELGIL